MRAFTSALAICAAESGLSLHVVQTTPSTWYAAFRDPDADELTPERGWGEGPTAKAAIATAVESFRITEAEARLTEAG